MKVAYLAPELPALSATFVYNEILQLEDMGNDVIPFSVHATTSTIHEPRVQALAAKTFNLYAQSKWSVIKDNVVMLAVHPANYVKTLGILFSDMWRIGLFSRTAFGLVYRMLFASSLARRLLQNQCKHLHVHFAHVPSDIAMYASSISGIPFSITAHANDLYERGWLLQEKVKRSSFFATISEFNQRYLADQGVDLDKVKIIRCGVDPAQFSQRQEVPNNAIPRIGVIGRLVEKKGIDTLIQAVAELRKQGTKVELLVAGSGPLDSTLKSLATEHELAVENIRFLGAIAHSEVAQFIKSLDMFVLPCKEDENGDIDGIPVVLMEAMLSCVPVISSHLSGIPELIIDEQTGLLIQQNDVAGLAKAILRLISERGLKEKLVEQAVSIVKDEFSLIENTKKLQVLFRSHGGCG